MLLLFLLVCSPGTKTTQPVGTDMIEYHFPVTAATNRYGKFEQGFLHPVV